MFSKYIDDFGVYFLCLLDVWVLRKCGKAKGNSFFFLLSFWFLRKHGVMFAQS